MRARDPASSPAGRQTAPAFPPAAQPDIIWKNQKDTYYQNVLREKVSDLYRGCFGPRRQVQNQKNLCLAADLCYFCLTTLLGEQTLGEEYCDLLQVDAKTKRHPRFAKRAALVAARFAFPHVLARLQARLPLRGNSRVPEPGGEAGPTEVNGRSSLARRRALLRAATSALWSFFDRHGRSMHLAVFYFYGTYYYFSERATRIRYILMRQLQPGEQRQGYEVLGALVFLQLAIRLVMFLRERTKAPQAGKRDAEAEMTTAAEKTSAQAYSGRHVLPDYTSERLNELKCALCLEPRTMTTSTPCGHLFCWRCICEWCRNKPECPLCRQPARLPHLLPLYHYDNSQAAEAVQK